MTGDTITSTIRVPAKLRSSFRRLMRLPAEQRRNAIQDIKEELQEIIEHYEAQHE